MRLSASVTCSLVEHESPLESQIVLLDDNDGSEIALGRTEVINLLTALGYFAPSLMITRPLVISAIDLTSTTPSVFEALTAQPIEEPTNS